MDFPTDLRAARTTDQFLLGPAFMVSPVTSFEARSREVHLPAGVWYDFWSGAAVEGGRAIDAPAPYDATPVHVRSGAIVPFGPELQWTDEKAADPLTVFVYTGANGSFTLYEDDGTSYAYETGAFARVPMTWDESKRTFTIGARRGKYPSMLASRTVQVVFVGRAKPVGFSFEPKPDRVVNYTGAAVEVKMP